MSAAILFSFVNAFLMMTVHHSKSDGLLIYKKTTIWLLESEPSVTERDSLVVASLLVAGK